MHSDFLTICYSGEEPENIFQIPINYKKSEIDGHRVFIEIETICQEYFLQYVQNYSIDSTLQFLNYHYAKYAEINESLYFLYFLEEEIEKLWGLPDSRTRILNEWINTKKKELEITEVSQNNFKKIKWNGSPSAFGYMFLELVKKGLIEPPLFNGDPNFAGLARLCFDYFDIATTPQNLEKELNENKNTLSDTKRHKFTIPAISDLQ